MSSSAEQLAQWLDEGLRHYGLGDPAKALDVWLRVLEAEPGNTRAKEYVEIVRSTYGEEAVAAATIGDDEQTEANELAASPSTPAEVVEAASDVKGAPSTPTTTVAVAEEPTVEAPPEALPVSTATTDEAEAAAPAPVERELEDSAPNPANAAIDPLDSVEGPNWADMAADAAVASAAFDAPSEVAPAPATASEPSPSEPAASEPAASEPAASEPAASEPAASEPAPSEPAASEAAANEPAPSEPAASEAAASEATTSYSVSSNQLTAKTIEIEDSVLAAAKTSTASGGAAASGGVTSGAAGPVVVDVSDDEPEEEKPEATSASVRIGRAPPIEESVSNVVHSVRYGESFDDGSEPSPRAGPFFTAIKEKAREESSDREERPAMSDSLELNRSEITTTAAPLPVKATLANTVELKSDELMAAQQVAQQAAPPSPPPTPPVETPLVDALDGANTVEIDRNAISQAATVEIPLPSIIAATRPTSELPSPTVGATQSLSGTSNHVQAAPNPAVSSTPVAPPPTTQAPVAQPSAAQAPVANPPVDIFAPTPVADVPAPHAADSSLFSTLPPTLVSSESEELAGSAVRDATQPGAASVNLDAASQNPWGEEGVPSTDLDVDPAAPSMFDLLLSASDKANQATPMDVAVQAHKPKPEDGRRGASQDMAPLSSASAFVHTPNTDPEADEDSSEKHESDVLMDGAKELFALGDFSGSLELVEKVLELAPDHPEAKKYFKQNSSTLLKMYESKLGNLESTPRQLTSPDEVIWMNMHHRAGFVLSQVDGMLTYEEIADVSGLPRLETFRILAELAQNGVIG